MEVLYKRLHVGKKAKARHTVGARKWQLGLVDFCVSTTSKQLHFDPSIVTYSF